jgi:hypothetical protein
MKVVINRCYGGFSLSQKAWGRLVELGVPVYSLDASEVPDGFIIFKDEKGEYWNSYRGQDERTEPRLIQVIEELGEEANTRFSELMIVEVPDDSSWYIDDYDGMEHVSEHHRTWY